LLLLLLLPFTSCFSQLALAQARMWQGAARYTLCTWGCSSQQTGLITITTSPMHATIAFTIHDCTRHLLLPP
jgi:hypothetical protein